MTDEDEEFNRIEREATMRKPKRDDDDDIQDYVRPWVGLTDEERFKVAEQTGCMSADWLDVVKATETALQIKNQ